LAKLATGDWLPKTRDRRWCGGGHDNRAAALAAAGGAGGDANAKPGKERRVNIRVTRVPLWSACPVSLTIR